MQSALAIRPVPLGPQTPCHQHLGKPHDPMVRAIMTFVAGTRRRDFPNWSNVRTHAQPRAELEYPRAWVPYMAGCEFSPATTLRTGAHAKYPTRYPPAYGHRPSRARAPRPDLRQEISGTCAD